ncbi:MAG: hypothetical protein AABY14_04210 [Nanoarchaeota archaeon]
MEKTNIKDRVKEIYDKKYKLLMSIPILIIILSLILVSYKYITTGDLFNKDISLSGGLTITIPTEKHIDIKKLTNTLSNELTGKQVIVRELGSGIQKSGVIIEVDMDGNNKEEVDNFINKVEFALGFSIGNNYSIEFIGSTLGQSFFRETMIAVLIAFISMAIVVTIYFRLLIPSIAVIAAAFGDIVVTLAIVNLMDMKIGTAGIAAFLMLIGYSVDTDMLLTTRVLKRKEGTVLDKVIDSVKTGMKMTLTTIFAVLVALLLTQSAIIKEIMIIVLIGLIVDMATTWFMNVGILRLYTDKKDSQKNSIT